MHSRSCPTRLILDLPATADRYGQHAAIARTIRDTIVEETGGVWIGVAGSWGGGKSTVVALLKDMLASTATEVWTFDAWAHEGDPLRRSFLEELISHLIEKQWISETKWRDELSRLTRRTKTTTQRSIPRLSPSGWILVSLLLIAPFGLLLFSSAIRQPESRSLVALGVAIGLLPLLFGGVLSVVTLLKKRRAKARNQRFTPDDLARIWGLLVQRGTSDIEATTIEDPDPSSVEFERIFSDILSEALASREDRRFVLVIDNLDRVEVEQAKKIWATLQTFLQPRNHRQLWQDRLWTIVPFDPGGLSRLWKQRDAVGNETEKAANAATPALDASFLDKSFQLRFEVASPLTTNWRQFLLDHLREALPNHEVTEFHDIYRICAIRWNRVAKLPTPRELKLLVNQIGTLHRRWCGKVALTTIAYYALLRREGADVVLSALRGEFPDSGVENFLDPNALADILGLAFGADSETAAQMALGPRLMEAILAGERDGVDTLRAAPGFAEVLEDSLARANSEGTWVPGSSRMRAALALEGVFGDDSDDPSLAGARREIIRAIRRTSDVGPLDARAEAGVIAAARMVNDADETKRLLQFAAEAMQVKPENEADDFVGRYWARAARLVRGLRDLGYRGSIKGVFSVPGGASTFVDLMASLAAEVPTPAQNDECWEWFRPAALPDTTVAIVSDIVNGKFGQNQFLAVRAISRTSTPRAIEPMLVAAQQRLQAQAGASSDEANFLVATVIEGLPGDTATEVLAELIDGGHVSHHLGMAAKGKHNAAIARCMLALMVGRPALETRGGPGEAANGDAFLLQQLGRPTPSVVNVLARLAMNAGRLPDLLKVADASDSTKKLVASVFHSLATNDELRDAREWFSPKNVVSYWGLLTEETAPGVLVALASANGDLAGLLRAGQFDEALISAYEAVVRDVGSAELRDWCVAQLEEKDEAYWIHALQGDMRVLGLLQACRGAGAQLRFGFALSEAIFAVAKSVAGGMSDAPAPEEVDVLVAALGQQSRQVLVDRVYELLGDSKGTVNAHLFERFRSVIDHGERLRRDERAVIRIVVPAVEVGNAEMLRWVVRVLEADGDALGAASKTHRELLKNKLAGIAEDGQLTPELHSMARILGIAGSTGEREQTEDAT